MKANEILRKAAEIMEDRSEQRDLDAERSMFKAVSTFNVLSGAALTENDGWLFMVCLKLARAQQGKLNVDDWLDAAAYCALTLECLLEDEATAIDVGMQMPMKGSFTV